ncbi:type II toxin-antitoxin system RelE/ParE family toxin [Pseudoxanthomonas sp. PXM02]|uniref:type II toxin-antitoxin system RelE/ParE family toxin n=1 Tax=Pseudoxanthomonas sp. PXM02 TaxID=2769294 RepID=UPI0017871013|nr:type II toxin-antitoxin system RelE/ParE family toxin [Pseudoxanthomonas sp. PXM02]MBD9477690.1 type II toxin-antitoxin system RelE/ParE family toxin [Pseudoxanthomonas sp. PXM02]
MTDAPSRARAALLHPLDREDRHIKRNERSIASLVSLLVHLLFVAALLYSSKMELAQPESASAGGARVKVDFLGDPTDATPNPPVPPTGTRNPSERPKPLKPLVTTPVKSPVDTTRVTEAENPVAPDESRPQPPASQQAVAPPQDRAPASPPAWRRSARWGQPPGMLAQDTAPDNYGPTVGAGQRQGNNQGNAANPSMEVDGHQIYYDLRNERKIAEWQLQGMKEIFFPLPGRSDLMVCALEIVATRGSGGCRLVQPGDPQLETIGDARDVVDVMRIYRRGELIWRGPGMYR